MGHAFFCASSGKEDAEKANSAGEDGGWDSDCWWRTHQPLLNDCARPQGRTRQAWPGNFWKEIRIGQTFARSLIGHSHCQQEGSINIYIITQCVIFARGTSRPIYAQVKEEPEEDTDAGKSSFSKAAATLRKADQKKRKPKVDSHMGSASLYEVVDDWDCMLNQTNIGHNNNKFYVIQLLKRGSSFYVWNRWFKGIWIALFVCMSALVIWGWPRCWWSWLLFWQYLLDIRFPQGYVLIMHLGMDALVWPSSFLIQGSRLISLRGTDPRLAHQGGPWATQRQQWYQYTIITLWKRTVLSNPYCV